MASAIVPSSATFASATWQQGPSMEHKLLAVGIIDDSIFNEILELDDNDDRTFTRALVEEYFSIAWSAGKEMMGYLHSMEYEQIVFQGQKLKGSSATIGFVAIAVLCDTIAQGASDIRDAFDAESMQKQRLHLRRLLIALNNQLRETEVVVARCCQQFMNCGK